MTGTVPSACRTKTKVREPGSRFAESLRVPRLRLLIVCLAVLLGCGRVAAAQDAAEPRTLPALADLARRVAVDPTTYAPAALYAASTSLDWVSSQPFFRAGYVEANPLFTVSGRSFDTPVAYGEGKRRILMSTLAVLPTSIANNALADATERVLVRRFPSHGKLFHILSWAERTGVASYLSYRLSSRHFSQWRANVNGASALGLP